MQVLPSPHLSNIVKHFLLIENDHQGLMEHHFFPDGNSGMVFHFGDPFLQHPESFIYGQVSKFRRIQSKGKIGMLIVVFQPHGAHMMLAMPANELNDQIISLSELWGSGARILQDQMLNAPDHRSRIAIIETFLTNKLSTCLSIDPLIQQSLDLIYTNRGLSPISELYKTLQISERQLERKFKENIGISPKYFSNIIRLQFFLKLYRTTSVKKNLTEIAYESGYYDQAHFIREFRKRVGLSPGQYIFKTNRLAVNLVQLTPLLSSVL
ncbi:DNA-binding transcriptional activator FeaR [compost metagenome]